MTEATGPSPGPAPSSAPGPRAVAVVVRAGRLLVIKRHFAGRDYAVLPGGSVEPGETFEQAAVRELRRSRASPSSAVPSSRRTARTTAAS